MRKGAKFGGNEMDGGAQTQRATIGLKSDAKVSSSNLRGKRLSPTFWHRECGSPSESAGKIWIIKPKLEKGGDIITRGATRVWTRRGLKRCRRRQNKGQHMQRPA